MWNIGNCRILPSHIPPVTLGTNHKLPKLELCPTFHHHPMLHKQPNSSTQRFHPDTQEAGEFCPFSIKLENGGRSTSAHGCSRFHPCSDTAMLLFPKKKKKENTETVGESRHGIVLAVLRTLAWEVWKLNYLFKAVGLQWEIWAGSSPSSCLALWGRFQTLVREMQEISHPPGNWRTPPEHLLCPSSTWHLLHLLT